MLLKIQCISILLSSVLSTTIGATQVFPVLGPNRFEVTITTAPLTDFKRTDPFAKDSKPREMMISIYNPVTKCDRKKHQAYMPPATAAFMDVKFGAYGLPNGSFPALELETCTSAPKSAKKSSKSKDFPLVLFSGALSTSRLLYNSMLQSIAAAGYLVISIDHPYDADFVEFPDGHTIQGVEIDDADLESALAVRVEDIAYVMQQLGNQSFVDSVVPVYDKGCKPSLRQTVVLGHSFGGAAAASTMRRFPSIGGGINLDGSMFGPVLNSGFQNPFMLMGHENKTQATDPSWKAIWSKLTGWKREFEVKKTAHYSFSDLPLLTQVLGLQKQLPQEVGQLLGTIEGSKMMDLTVSYITTFLDSMLKHQSRGFGNLAKEFPEVVLRSS